MISVVARGLALSQHLKAVSAAVGPSALSAVSLRSQLIDGHIDAEHLLPGIMPHDQQWLPVVSPADGDHELRPSMTPADQQWLNIAPVLPPPPLALTAHALQASLPRRRPLVGAGVGVSGVHVRCAHTDIRVPSFADVRRPSTRSPASRNADSVDPRRVFTYAMTAGVGVTAVIAAKGVVQTLVGALQPTKDLLILGKVEVNVGAIPEGKSVTVKWRGKPIFIRRRTAEEVARERAVNTADLRDPERDEDRVQQSEWLIVIGICTHLGCIPLPYKGDYGGYYCPCHGSHYDASGRIRKGPAPQNLEVPEYTLDGDSLVIG